MRPTTDPYFSVVSAVLNPPSEIRALLASLLEQTEQSWEWVIQDGGQDSALRELLRAEPEGRIAYRSEPDTGIYDGLNKAVSRARGRYIVILGADDRLAADDVLDRLRRAIDRAGSEPDVVLGSAMIASSEFTSSLGPKTLMVNTVHHQGAAYHRRQFDEFAFDTSSRIVADYEHSLRLFLRRSTRIDSGVMISVCGDEGVSRRTSERRLYADMHVLRSKYLPRPVSRVLQAIGLVNVSRRALQHRTRRAPGIAA